MDATPSYFPEFRKKGRRKVVIGYRVSWKELTGRKRKFVKTEQDARDLVESTVRKLALVRSGIHHVTTKLNQREIDCAFEAYQRLAGANFLVIGSAEAGAQLVKAVDWFVRHYQPPKPAPTFTEFIPMFLDSRAKKNQITRDDYKRYLLAFSKAGFADTPINRITSEDIHGYLAALQVGETTRAKHFGALRAFFYEACKKTAKHVAFIGANPAIEVEAPKPSKPRRHIYTVNEVKALIEVSSYLGCLPLVVFRLFTMLRHEEAARFLARSQKEIWEDINLGTHTLRYHEPDHTENPRPITIPKVLVRWLQLFQNHGIEIIDTKNEQDARKAAVPEKFGDGFQNLIRHTAITYRAVESDSVVATATQAGNSEPIIRRHYLGRATKEEAKAFHKLRPEIFNLEAFLANKGSRCPLKDIQALTGKYPGLRALYETN